MTRPCRFAVFLALGVGLLAPTHLFAQAAIAVNGAYLDWRYLNGATVPPATGLTECGHDCFGGGDRRSG